MTRTAILKALALTLVVALLASPTTAAYYADSIEALGYNATFSGIHLGSGSTDNYLSTSPTGTGNATLYIGSARILTEGASLNPAGGWFDSGSAIALEDNADNVGIGTASPAEKLHVSGGNILIEEGYGIRIANASGTETQFITTYGPYNFGFGAYMQTGGQLIIGAGESASTAYSQIGGTTEQLWLTSDGNIKVATGVQAGWANRFSFDFGTDGSFSIPGNLSVGGEVDGYDISTYGPYFISSAGSNGQVWKSDGSGAGYWATDNVGLTSESDTLDSVTGRGSSTANSITVGGLSTSGDVTANQLILDSTATGDKLSLYGNRFGTTTMYGFGVESSTTYYKSAGNHRWYSGANADGGASDVMQLDGSGNLFVAGDLTLGSTTVQASDLSILTDGVIALGTETSGNYVSSVSAGTGLAVSGTAGEGWTPSLSVDTSYNNFDVEAESGGVYIASPGGAKLSLSGTQTGAIKITLPQSWSNTMMRMTVDIYDYGAQESVSIHLGGYNYASGSNWYNTFAQIISGRSDKDFNVRFGHDGTRNAIWIGETTSTWSYPQVVVRDFYGGNSISESGWDDGWDLTIESSLGTVTDTESSNYVYSDWNKMKNIPAGFADGVDADSYPGDLFVDTTGDTMTGVLNMGYNRVQFYGTTGNAHHSIGSQDIAGSNADDMRINTYGALYVNLDSNNNNAGGADFLIGRHGGTGTITDELLRVDGETSTKLEMSGGNIILTIG